jgi:hypothetical protein
VAEYSSEISASVISSQKEAIIKDTRLKPHICKFCKYSVNKQKDIPAIQVYFTARNGDTLTNPFHISTVSLSFLNT